MARRTGTVTDVADPGVGQDYFVGVGNGFVTDHLAITAGNIQVQSELPEPPTVTRSALRWPDRDSDSRFLSETADGWTGQRKGNQGPGGFAGAFALWLISGERFGRGVCRRWRFRGEQKVSTFAPITPPSHYLVPRSCKGATRYDQRSFAPRAGLLARPVGDSGSGSLGSSPSPAAS
jgi:hypothetical protein